MSALFPVHALLLSTRAQPGVYVMAFAGCEPEASEQVVCMQSELVASPSCDASGDSVSGGNCAHCSAASVPGSRQASALHTSKRVGKQASLRTHDGVALRCVGRRVDMKAEVERWIHGVSACLLDIVLYLRLGDLALCAVAQRVRPLDFRSLAPFHLRQIPARAHPPDTKT